jgi:hypothetical protein
LNSGHQILLGKLSTIWATPHPLFVFITFRVVANGFVKGWSRTMILLLTASCVTGITGHTTMPTLLVSIGTR